MKIDDHDHGQADHEEVQQLHGVGRARELGDGREHRPPEDHRGGHDHEVLHDVDRVIVHRQVVERRQVPRHQHQVEARRSAEDGRVRTRPSRSTSGWREERRQHPARRAVEQERRHGEGQQQVLDHVGAEEVVVREVVQRAGERAEEHGEAREEGQRLGPLDALGPGRARRAAQRASRRPPPRSGEARDHDGIGVPGGPVEAVRPEGRRPRGPGYYVRHDPRASAAAAGGRRRRAP